MFGELVGYKNKSNGLRWSIIIIISIFSYYFII